MRQRSAAERRRIRRARDKRTVARMRRRVLAACGRVCHLCGQPIDTSLPQYDPLCYEVDHVVPVDLGGTTTLANCRPSHRTCNRARSTKSVEVARLELAGLGGVTLPPEGEYIRDPHGRPARSRFLGIGRATGCPASGKRGRGFDGARGGSAVGSAGSPAFCAMIDGTRIGVWRG